MPARYCANTIWHSMRRARSVSMRCCTRYPLACYTTDAAGRITFFNETAAAMWGRRPRLNSEQWCGSWRMYWPMGLHCRTTNARWRSQSSKGEA